MPVSNMDNDVSCNEASIVTTSQNFRNSLDNGDTFATNVKSHGKIPFLSLTNDSQSHINFDDENAQVRCEGQIVQEESVDHNHQNSLFSTSVTKNKAVENSFLSPKVISNQTYAPANENSCLSTYGLNNSMTLNDGKESIELMVNSLSSIGNHEDAQINNNGCINIDSDNGHETDTSFNKLNENIEAPSEEIPKRLKPDTRQRVENPINNSTNKEVLSSSNKEKIEHASKPDADNFHDINEIEATPARRSSSHSNQSISSFNSNKDAINKPLLDTSKPTQKEEIEKQSNEPRKESITPKIIISNKTINSCMLHSKKSNTPSISQNKIVLPSNQKMVHSTNKSVSKFPSSRLNKNTTSGVTTPTINAPPMRNHQAPLSNKTFLFKSGILSVLNTHF